MNMRNGFAQYRDQQILTASPGDLVLMLYDGAIRQIRTASTAISDRRILDAGTALVKAQDFVCALIDGLDMSVDLSAQLLMLYDHINRELVETNLSKDIARAEQTERMLMDLRTVWADAFTQCRTSACGMGG